MKPKVKKREERSTARDRERGWRNDSEMCTEERNGGAVTNCKLIGRIYISRGSSAAAAKDRKRGCWR